MSDHALAILGLVGSIVFGVVSLVLGWRALLPKSLSWGSSTEIVSTGTGRGQLSITFEDRHFSEVAITRLAIWNHGRGSIAGAEVSKADPLRVELSAGAEFLSAAIIEQTGNGVAPSLANLPESKAAIILSFDVMNEGDGFALRLLHHGSSKRPAIKGTIRDVPTFVEVSIGTDPFVMPRRIMIAAGLFGMAFGAIVLSLFALWISGPNTQIYLPNLKTLFATVGVIVGVLFGIILGMSRWGALVPSKLTKVFSDSDG